RRNPRRRGTGIQAGPFSATRAVAAVVRYVESGRHHPHLRLRRGQRIYGVATSRNHRTQPARREFHRGSQTRRRQYDFLGLQQGQGRRPAGDRQLDRPVQGRFPAARKRFHDRRRAVQSGHPGNRERGGGAIHGREFRVGTRRGDIADHQRRGRQRRTAQLAAQGDGHKRRWAIQDVQIGVRSMSEDTRGIDAGGDTPEQTERSGRSVPRAWHKVKPVPVILVVLLLISGGAATWLYFTQYRPDKQTDAGVASAVINSASEGTVAILSYSPESLDKDFAAAKSHLSGDFLSYYNQFTEQIVAPAAKQKSLK